MSNVNTGNTFENSPLSQAVAEYEQTLVEVRALLAEMPSHEAYHDGPHPMSIVARLANSLGANMRQIIETE